MIKGNLFDITRGSFNDGPGIRTVLFFQGCPLDCPWCHNPESKTETSSKCNSYSTDELLTEVVKDLDYFKASGGGLTISGGEPLLQIDFLEELVIKVKEAGLEIALETSGFAPIEHLMRIRDYIDLFLLDYKYYDRKIEENFTYLYNSGAEIIRRCPIIPEVNLTPSHMKQIAELSMNFPKIKYIELLPYHTFWQGKEVVTKKLSLPSLDNKSGRERIKTMIKRYNRRNIILNSEIV